MTLDDFKVIADDGDVAHIISRAEAISDFHVSPDTCEQLREGGSVYRYARGTVYRLYAALGPISNRNKGE
jgi:hypothetical protein